VYNSLIKQIWRLYGNKFLFRGQHPDGSGYDPVARVVEKVAVLGPPPLDWLEQDSRMKACFDDKDTEPKLLLLNRSLQLIDVFAGRRIVNVPLLKET
jgi:hypothetical protein